MGDFKAKVGSENKGYESCMGQGVGERNDNREKLVCLENGLVTGGTIFLHKTIHKLIWVSPDGRIIEQIKHTAINQK
jgi:hypothetical protein